MVISGNSKMHNIKEQVEESKLQFVKFEEKRSTKKQNEAKSYIQGDKQINKWKKRSDDLTARPHPARFPTVEKN